MDEDRERGGRRMDDPAMRRIVDELMVTTTCPRHGSTIVDYRCERVEHVLIYLAPCPTWLPFRNERIRRSAVRKGLIRNTRRTTGLDSGIGGPQWIYEITDAGRERLAAYDRETGYRPS